MTVTIVVPVYNAEKSLCRCVQSILDQSFGDYELLLVDDGSRDGSAEICEEFCRKDPRVRYLFKENGGSASARNYGIERAKGEYIQFVDSDDYIDREMTQRLWERATAFNSDLVICGMSYVTRKGVSGRSFGEGDWENSDAFLPVLREFLHKGILHSCVNKLYRRERIFELMNPEFRWGEDFAFNVKYFLGSERISLIDDAPYYYDCTTVSLTRGQYISRKSYLKNLYTVCVNTFVEKYGQTALSDVLQTMYLKDLLADYQNTTSVFKMRKKHLSQLHMIEGSLFGTAVPGNSQIDLLCEGKHARLCWGLRKSRAISKAKQIIKRMC